jgi:hypothetical protein
VIAGGYWLLYGMLPMRRLNTRLAGPDPALEKVLADVSRGHWETAEELLTATGSDWERRTLYTQRLADVAGHYGDDGWLKAWQAARPADPGAALVQAQARVGRAWKLRGAKFARHTSHKQLEGFHRELTHSHEDIVRAVSLNPEDPTPLITEIWVALGLGCPHQEMHELWALLTARAPHHFDAHYSALQYWCAKWRGSKQAASDFAQRAAEGAPAGSLMAALPLIAWYENNHLDDVPASAYRTAPVRALVDAALADVAAAGDHPRLPTVRHLLAYFLVRQQRYQEALEQFHLVDGYLAALPWRYASGPFGKALRYRAMRTKAARGAWIASVRHRTTG